MKIFVTTSRVPWPLEKGDKLRIYHQIAELHKRHEIILCCLNDKKTHPDTQQELSKICTELHIFNLTKLGIAYQLFLSIFSSKPFQIHYFYQKKIRKEIYHLIESTKPDVIYTQLIRTAEYVKHLHHIPKTLDYMDAFSKGMARRIKKAKFPFKFLLKTEAKRLLAYEQLIFDYYEHQTIISAQDRNYIPHDNRKQIVTIPNGIDKVYFSPKKTKITHQLVFTGNMNYPPNVEGASYIINEIMPLIWKTHPGVNLLIAGANPTPKLKALASDQVIIQGWMDDIRDAYNTSAIFIAPMNIGTGLQNKLLEAMSMQLPCITSKLANNALGAQEGIQILIGNSPAHYAQHVIDLIENKKLAEDIAKAGQAYIHRNFSWKSSTEKLEKLFKS